MYVVVQIGAVACYLLAIAVAALLARRRGGTWRAFVRGTIFMAVGSTLGGFVGGVLIGGAAGLVFRLILHQKPPLPISAAYPMLGVVPGVLVGACEEIARLLGMRRGRDKLSYRLGDALMFAAGFGGTELVFRCARIVLQTIRYSSASLTPPIIEAISASAALAIEIYIWHICMTIIAYRLWSDVSWRRAARILAPSMVTYHASANLIAGSLALEDPITHLYSLLFWTTLTPFHIIVATWSVRRAQALAAEAASPSTP